MKNEQLIGSKLTLFKFKHFDKIKEHINVPDTNIIHFFNNRKWHSYELLLYLLFISGPGNVIVTTFGLSEEAIRALNKAKQAGYIKKLTLILNKSSKQFKKPLLYFLKNIADETYFTLIHAKIFLISNNDFKITVNQSANFSTNPTIESGIVTNNNEVFDLYFKNIQMIINNSNKL